jgi:hypothetical protein
MYKEPQTPEIDLWKARIIAMLEHSLSQKYNPGETKRFFHPKMHGLIEAELIIDHLSDPRLAKGLFASPGIYPSWIRFSNSSPKVGKDIKKDFRGAAIKVLQVPGPKIVDDGNASQDFVFVNKSTFQAKNVPMIGRAIRAITGNIFHKLTFALRYLPDLLKSLGASRRCSNLLDETYFSQTAYAFGESDIVKFKLEPVKQFDTLLPENPSPDFLRQQLALNLSSGDSFFNLMVQFRENPHTMSVENPSVEWKSPFHKVATLKVKKQTFDFIERDKEGESMAFSPWHCLEAHRPLGNINQVRRQIYEVLSKYRNERNHRTNLVQTQNMITEA